MNIDMLGIQFLLLYYQQLLGFDLKNLSSTQLINGFDVFDGTKIPRGIFFNLNLLILIKFCIFRSQFFKKLIKLKIGIPHQILQIQRVFG